LSESEVTVSFGASGTSGSTGTSCRGSSLCETGAAASLTHGTSVVSQLDDACPPEYSVEPDLKETNWSMILPMSAGDKAAGKMNGIRGSDTSIPGSRDKRTRPWKISTLAFSNDMLHNAELFRRRLSSKNSEATRSASCHVNLVTRLRGFPSQPRATVRLACTFSAQRGQQQVAQSPNLQPLAAVSRHLLQRVGAMAYLRWQHRNNCNLSGTTSTAAYRTFVVTDTQDR
jgi:hypothetical protein